MLWFAVLLLSLMIETVAFFPMPTTATTRRAMNLHGAVGDDGQDIERNNTRRDDSSGTDGLSFDVEYNRQRLENLLSSSKDGIKDDDKNRMNNNDDNGTNSGGPPPILFSKIISDYADGIDFSLSSFPSPPPLSSTERDRRLIEIKLLECLSEDDDAVSELWQHWYSERGSTAQSRIEEISEKFTDADFQECEKDLIEMIDEYGIYFVAPVNLLATLYFMVGKLELSYKLCEIILVLKPYHIGALSGIVQVAIRLRDPDAARKWALKRLPSLASNADIAEADTSIFQREEIRQIENSRRTAWVETAVSQAKGLLEQADRRTKENFFGEPESYYDVTKESGTGNDRISGINYSDDELDDNAWQ